MRLVTFTYAQNNQWSVNPLPPLDSPQTLVIAFGASSFIEHPEPIQTLTSAYPTSHVIGCSTAGEIFGAQIHDESLSVAVMQFEDTLLKRVVTPILPGHDITSLAETLLAALFNDDLRGIFLLASSLDFNFGGLIDALNSRLSPDVVVTGGIAGDGDRFQRNWIVQDGVPTESSLSAVGFYGRAIHIGVGSQGGWQPSGIPMLITRSQNNVLYELNGQPALRVYKRYLFKQSAKLPAAALLYPLAVSPWAGGEKYVVRTILSINEQEQSMIFAGDIPRHYFGQFMRAGASQIIGGALQAAQMAESDSIPEANPMLSIAISCVGRRLVLKEDTPKELDAVLSVFPAGTQQIGFYSYGEICPVAKGGFTDLHNQTMTLTTISERSDNGAQD